MVFLYLFIRMNLYTYINKLRVWTPSRHIIPSLSSLLLSQFNDTYQIKGAEVFGMEAYQAVHGSQIEETDKVIIYATEKFDEMARKIRDACLEKPTNKY